MARYRRYRRYRRKSTKWASNITEFIENTFTANPQSQFFGSSTLVVNPAQSNTGASQIFTVKNIEASFEMETAGPSSGALIESLAYYIMFVPQGMTITEDYNLLHPEYVMAYKFYGSPQADATGTTNNAEFNFRVPLRVKTRLSRKLNTGDRIILFIKGLNQSTSTTLHVNGLVRWWTKAN